MTFNIFKIKWDTCKLPCRRDACYQYYEADFFGKKHHGMKLFTFKRVADAHMYKIKVFWLGDLLYQDNMETIWDLLKFCNKVMYTKFEKNRVETPGLIQMIRLFKWI